MALPAHRFTTADDDVPMTLPVARFPGMNWPGDDEVAQVPVALILAARGRCSCEACCEGFVHMMRRVRLKAV
jgi:hypothetical protein